MNEIKRYKMYINKIQYFTDNFLFIFKDYNFINIGSYFLLIFIGIFKS